jgi:two-component system nitrogen regulation response regulator GlnG
VFTIAVPPLRELGQDKLRLLEHFRVELAERSGTTPFVLGPAAQARWAAYPFPGNVRELRNIVIRLHTKFAGESVGELDLEGEFAPVEPTEPQEASGRLGAARAEIAAGRPFSLDATLRSAEAIYLDAAIDLAHGNMSQAAKLLGLSRSTFYSRLEACGRQASPPARATQATSGKS